jgi:hypothetical protein
MSEEPEKKIYSSTIYKLTHGNGLGEKAEPRYFSVFFDDAATRFAEQVVKYDKDPEISAAWVHLDRLPDSIYPEGSHILGWTKTSDERPTEEGSLTPEE